MTSEPLRFHPEAEQEYLTALAWYRERSLIAAINFEIAFDRGIAGILEAPQRWAIFIAAFRKYTLGQYPFSVIYQDLRSEVAIFAVAHGRRRPGYWRDRV